MKPARIAVFAVAAVAAIGLALVVRAMGSSGDPVAVATAAPAPPPVPMARVLVASRDLAPGTRLADADLEFKEWPVAQVIPTFITDGSRPVEAKAEEKSDKADDDKPEGAVARVTRTVEAIASGGAEADYYGSVVREPIAAGEPIIARKIVRAGDSGYMAAYLEPGMRAMAIRVTVETAAGGFILPGDRVDVILTRELGGTTADTPGAAKFASSTVMQNVKVLAIDQSTRAADEEQAVVGATATLELLPRDSEIVALAKSEGELSLVLRSYADTSGPSGRVSQPRAEARAVKVFRGGEPQTVMVQ